MNNRHRVLAALLVGMVLAAGGCTRTLFSDADPYYQERVRRYWGDDSAEKTSAERQRGSEMGFGFPTGMANQ